jgi:predicted transposase YbfD/YdcC
VLLSTGMDLTGKDITVDALLTQRNFALAVRNEKAHYHFTVKGNQPTLLQGLQLHFQSRSAIPLFSQTSLGHGRIETRSIWVTKDKKLNDHLDFPDLTQAFLIERKVINKKTGASSTELAYGISSRPDASPERLLQINRGHWTIENRCHWIIDWNYDEDRSRIRMGHGPQNITRLRRFAIGLILSRGKKVAETLRYLDHHIRTVFDYLLMTENSRRRSPAVA